MTNGVEGCSKVEEDDDTEVTRVQGAKKVVGDFEGGCFSAVL